MEQRSGIRHRYSYIQASGEDIPDSLNGGALFRTGRFPETAERMGFYEKFAPRLLRETLDRLELTEEERRSIRHVIVTTCTGLFAPGLDFTAIEHLQLSPETERTTVGFMGCYAAINGLKLADYIVRANPESSVLLINLELCTLHFQESQDIQKLLSFLLFGDGCAASLIRAADHGVAIDSFRAITIPQSQDLIQWRIGASGFDMDLSGQIPIVLRKTLRECAEQFPRKEEIDLWAVHPGGRSILDAVSDGFELEASKLSHSRSVLDRFGNMSSATIMFVLQELAESASRGQRGYAMGFGPGVTAETMSFHVL